MRIFLSQATGDALLAERVVVAIRPLGAEVFLAENDDRAGANVHARIQDEIRRSDFVILLLTEAAAASAYVNQEIGFARRDRKLIVPIVASSMVGTDLGMLSGIEYIVIGDEAPDRALRRLHRRVQALGIERAQREVLGLLLIVLGVLIVAMLDGA